MKAPLPLGLLLAGFAALRTAAAPTPAVFTDGAGGIRAVMAGGEFVPVRSEIRIAGKGWYTCATTVPWALTDVEHRTVAGRRFWRERTRLTPTDTFLIEISLVETGGVARMDVALTPESDAVTEGAFFFLDVPVDRFAGGTAQLCSDAATVAAALPLTAPTNRPLLAAQAQRAVLRSGSGRTTVEAVLSQAQDMAVQDNRGWDLATYSLWCRFADAPLRRDQTVRFSLSLVVRNAPDPAPAHLRIYPALPLYRFDGFGGNFCFINESPVTDFNLATLKPVWARLHMSLEAWEPTNDNDSADVANWPAFEARDVPGSALQAEFLQARALQQRGLRGCVSTWYFPPWMYAFPEADREASGHEVETGKWPEVFESIVTYLQYAKRKYGVEPELFSFNEPDIGVHVAIASNAYPTVVKELGRRFRAAGLRTRILLGDNALARTLPWLGPAAADADAVAEAGALAFHTWNTLNPSEFEGWAELAARLKLPLLVTEFGTDPSAWRMPWTLASYEYAISELRLYQAVLAKACPQSVLLYELTGDYALATVKDGAVVTGARYAFFRHFCNLTPRGSEAICTDSNHPDVTFTAFRGRTADGAASWALHIANTGAARAARLTGLPPDVRRLYPVTSGLDRSWEIGHPLHVHDGALDLSLPSLSLTTLLTSPVSEERTTDRRPGDARPEPN